MSPHELAGSFSVPEDWKETLRGLVRINESCGVLNRMLPWSLSDCDDLGILEVAVFAECLLNAVNTLVEYVNTDLS